MISQIWYMALENLQRQYLGTRLGLVWAVVQPAVTFAVFYFVSVYGLRMGSHGDGVPYFAVLFCGLLPWMTLSSAVTNSNSSLRAHRHLIVEKSAPPFAIVMASSLAAVMMHLPIFAIVAVIFLFGGVPASLSWLAIVYYMVCLAALSLATGCFIAPFSAFSRDFTQFVSTFLLVWFWGSPVIWSPSLVPPGILEFMKINPFFYVIEGYRGALLYDTPLADGVVYAGVFWGTIAMLFVAGIWMLDRFTPMFAEWLQR